MSHDSTTLDKNLSDTVDEVERAFDRDDLDAGNLREDLRRKASELRDRLNTALHQSADATERALRKGYDRAEESLREGVDYTERKIKDHPFASVGIAAGVGVLIGLMINRNR